MLLYLTRQNVSLVLQPHCLAHCVKLWTCPLRSKAWNMAASAPASSDGSLSLNSSYSASIWVDPLTKCDIFCRKVDNKLMQCLQLNLKVTCIYSKFPYFSWIFRIVHVTLLDVVITGALLSIILALEYSKNLKMGLRLCLCLRDITYVNNEVKPKSTIIIFEDSRPG